MKARHTILLILLLCWTPLLWGQESPTKASIDILYLKDGSVLKGEILSYEKGKTLVFQLQGGQELQIQETEIDEIEQDKKIRRDPLAVHSIYHAFYVSSNHGSNFRRDNDWGLGLEVVSGIWLDETFGLGIGTGIMRYSMEYPWTVAPIFVDLKIKSSQRSPFFLGIDGGIGYALRSESNNVLGGQPGERIRVGMGKMWATKSTTKISVELSYLHQRAKFRGGTWGWPNSEDILVQNMRFKRYQLRFGVIF